MERDDHSDDRTLGWMLVVIGAIRIAIGIGEHEVFRAEATVALLMLAGGVAVLACTPWRTR